MKSLFNEKIVVEIKPEKRVIDIFDEIELEDKEVFKKVIPPTKEELAKKAEEAKLIARIKSEVLASIKIPTAPPPVKEVEVKIEEKEKPEEETDDTEEMDDETDKKMEEMCAEMEKMKAMMENHHKKMKDMADNTGPVFIPASPIIPNWSDKNDKYLYTKNGQLLWAEASSNGGASANPFYIGDSGTEGSWRFFIVGTDLSFQRLESGTWTEKGVMQA